MDSNIVIVSSEEALNFVPNCVSGVREAVLEKRPELKRATSQSSLSDTARFSKCALGDTDARVRDVDSMGGRLNHKRRRQHRGTTDGRAISAIEDLPAEILQRIFFDSCNGNLLLAAPRIAARLSGIESLYAATFAIAFYSHQLNEVLGLLRLRHWTSTINLPVKLWEIRSMTKAILGSRWCTCGWVKDFMVQLKTQFLLDTQKTLASGKDFAGYPDLEVDAAADFDEDFDKVYKRPSRLQGPLHPLLAEDFNLELNIEEIPRHEDPDEEERHLEPFDFYPPWAELTFRRIIWKFCGAAALSSFYGLDSYQPDALFRDMVRGEVGYLRYLTKDPFAQVQDEYRRRCCDNWGSISDLLAVDYYYHPEDHPFKIDPSLFRIAALADMRFRPRGFGRHEHSCWTQFVMLFEADPTSLPRTDPVIIAYANHIAHRIQRSQSKIVKTRYWMRKLKQDGVMIAKYHQLACDWLHEIRHLHRVDRLTLGYIFTGFTDLLPDNDQPNPTISNRCEAHVSYPEIEYIADDDEGSLRQMKKELAKKLREAKLLTPFGESSFSRSKEDVASILEEYSGSYLDPNPSDNTTRIKWPSLGFTDMKYDIRCANADNDWHEHPEMREEGYLRRLPDTRAPWSNYRRPTWFSDERFSTELVA